MQANNSAPYSTLLESTYYANIITLNFKPLEWVHDDWLTDIPFIEQLRQLSTPEIQQYINEKLALPPCLTEEFEMPLRRLIFLPRHQFQRLTSIIGLSCFQQQLITLIEKKTRIALTNLLGENCIRLLQTKLPLMITRFPDALSSSLPLYNSAETRLRHYYPYGARLLSIAADSGNSPWHRYLLHKLPKFDDSLDEIKQISLTIKEKERIAILIRKISLEFDKTCTHLLN